MSAFSQPLVSIIVPVYNEAQYIAECIESLLAQTYQNWECIIANNCSTDGSGEIGRKYAAKDARIRVHDNEQFLRAVPNYNQALRRISPASKYCKVIFADDWIFPECLERMVGVAEAHPSIGIVGAYGLQGRQVVWTGLPYPSTLVSGTEVCRRLFIDGIYVFGSATSLLYRADLVRRHDPFYDESNIHSDMETCIKLLKSCDFGFVHQVLTFGREEQPGCLRRISEDLNTHTAGHFYNLAVHGRDYLTPQEFQSCMSRSLTGYYAVLAGAVVRSRNKKFWDYHKQRMAAAGVGFSRVRLVRTVVAKLFDTVLNPKAMVEKGWQIAREVIARRRRSFIHSKSDVMGVQVQRLHPTTSDTGRDKPEHEQKSV